MDTLKPKNLKGELKSDLNAFLRDFLDLVLKYALSNLEKNGSWVTGNLAQSGRVELKRSLAILEGEVLFSAPYAAFVEFGTRPHAAPLGPELPHTKEKRPDGSWNIEIMGTPNMVNNPLDYWAWKKGKKEAVKHKKYGVHTALGLAVWFKIIARGSDPHPYLRPAVEKAKTHISSLAKKHGLEFE